MRVIKDLVASNPDSLGHIVPAQILIVAGAARNESKASVRAFTPHLPSHSTLKRCPEVTRHGQKVLYEICLRPRYFLESTGEERLHLLAHELYHIAPAFDGTLAEDRRHDVMSNDAWGRALDPILAQTTLSATARQALFQAGTFTLDAWRIRPPSHIPKASNVRHAYSEEDLYLAIITQS